MSVPQLVGNIGMTLSGLVQCLAPRPDFAPDVCIYKVSIMYFSALYYRRASAAEDSPGASSGWCLSRTSFGFCPNMRLGPCEGGAEPSRPWGGTRYQLKPVQRAYSPQHREMLRAPMKPCASRDTWCIYSWRAPHTMPVATFDTEERRGELRTASQSRAERSEPSGVE